jgi:hypothetical protein
VVAGFKSAYLGKRFALIMVSGLSFGPTDKLEGDGSHSTVYCVYGVRARSKVWRYPVGKEKGKLFVSSGPPVAHLRPKPLPRRVVEAQSATQRAHHESEQCCEVAIHRESAFHHHLFTVEPHRALAPGLSSGNSSRCDRDHLNSACVRSSRQLNSGRLSIGSLSGGKNGRIITTTGNASGPTGHGTTNG